MRSSQAAAAAQPLITGQRMNRKEFLRRWEQLPDVKHAELIQGVVYVASPISEMHDEPATNLIGWLVQYRAATPGCKSGSNMTWLMLESSPQADCFLRLLPEYGGQSFSRNNYGSGAPELAVEVTISSASMDFGPKLALYQRAGVKEYITVEPLAKRIIWRRLNRAGAYASLLPDTDRVYRSKIFPGLWLDPAALWSGDVARMFAVLQQGLESREHGAFVEKLRKAHTAARRANLR